MSSRSVLVRVRGLLLKVVSSLLVSLMHSAVMTVCGGGVGLWVCAPYVGVGLVPWSASTSQSVNSTGYGTFGCGSLAPQAVRVSRVRVSVSSFFILPLFLGGVFLGGF